MGDKGIFYADQHYEAAIQNMDEIISLGDSRSVTYLLLLALYCLKGTGAAAAWTLAGLSVRLCIELGMHRKPVAGEITIKNQLEARVFWSCYYLDRGISVALSKSLPEDEYTKILTLFRPSSRHFR